MSRVDKNIINILPVPLIQISNEGQLLLYNHSFQHLLGLSAEELVGLNFFNNSYRIVDSANQILPDKRQEDEFVIESYWRKNDSGFLYIKEHYIFEKEGGYLVYLEDDSEKRRLRRSLEITEEKFRFIIDQAPVGIYRIIATGEIVFANHFLAHLFGYKTGEELQGKMARDLFQYPSEYESLLQSAIKHKKSTFRYEFSFITPEGKTYWLEDTAHIFYDTSDEMLFYDGIIQNITEKKQIENDIKRLLTAFGQISEAIVITDTRGYIIYSNPALEKMTGYLGSELLGKNMSIFRSGVHSKEFYKGMWNNILHGVNWEGTIINKRKDGELYTEYMVITPVKNNEGQVINFVAVKRDMSELLKLEDKLRHSQKLQAIGTLAGGIAHDFNNILMGMQIYTEVLLKRVPSQSFEHELVGKIYESQNRAKELIQQILSFSRPGTEEKAPLAVHTVIKETLKLIKNTFPATITIKENIDDCGFTLANPTHIHQIIMNLCTNAQDAMQGHGNLTVELHRKSYIEYPSGEKQDTGHDWICLCVKDTGCGIEESIRSRIFDPFFTTKQVGEGTGLGLSIVQGIVKDYGGEIFFDTKVGEGTTFYVYLPAR
ncbi:MAG: PAS domain S-box protein [Bacteroidales bacterium]|nr:PAS domain S-box protein [Bacteroidales bacterium]